MFNRSIFYLQLQSKSNLFLIPTLEMDYGNSNFYRATAVIFRHKKKRNNALFITFHDRIILLQK
tara:strand:- start:1070 stop:1261 length:192 start_codon:yes stop_codon:yes gene_type:complete